MSGQFAIPNNFWSSVRDCGRSIFVIVLILKGSTVLRVNRLIIKLTITFIKLQITLSNSEYDLSEVNIMLYKGSFPYYYIILKINAAVNVENYWPLFMKLWWQNVYHKILVWLFEMYFASSIWEQFFHGREVKMIAFMLDLVAEGQDKCVAFRSVFLIWLVHWPSQSVHQQFLLYPGLPYA